MKKLLYFVPLTALFLFLFAFNVKAATYQADELQEGQLLEAGDILEFGSGVYLNEAYERVELAVNLTQPDSYFTRDNQFVLPQNLFVIQKGIGTSNGTSALVIYANTTKCYFHLGDNKPLPITYDHLGMMYQKIAIKKGETKRVYFTCIGGTEPITVKLQEVLLDGGYQQPIVKDTNYHDIPYGQYLEIVLKVYCEGGNRFDNFAGEMELFIVEDNNQINGTISNNTESNREEPQTPSELPYGTVKCGNGGKGNWGKDAVDVKVLSPEQRDTTNQNAFAKNYFKNRSFSTIFSYNVYPPYGVNNGYKNSTRIIYWADTGLKQGDEVYAVWYCQSSKKGVQMIKCDIDANGIVSIRIPQIGDMSTITLIKVK